MGGQESRRAACATAYSSLYEISFPDMDGNPVPLSRYQGQVLIIVNVASKCGLTETHYEQLKELQEKYQSRGFTVLGFPCNQFMGQEPGSCDVVKLFLAKKGVTFPVFNKVEINGAGAHDLFKYLRLHSRLDGGKIGWNFGKFLIDRQGKIINYYGPRTKPKEMIPDIEAAL